MLTRRQILKSLLLGAAGLALPTNSAVAEILAQTADPPIGPGMGGMGMGGMGMGGGMMGRMAMSPPVTPFQVPLPMPAALQPTVKIDPVTGAEYDHYEVSIKAGEAQILPGLTTPIYGYEGQFPGPSFVTRSGRKVVARFTNMLPEPAVVHLHGGHVSARDDGHSMDFIQPGASREYVYPNNQIASTLWYHDHTMNLTASHVIKGMAGFYIIQDDFEDNLPLPKGEQDVALVIQDRLFNADGSFSYQLNPMTIMQGFYGDTILVNGAPQPFMKVANRKYRFRILNGSNARFYQLALSTGQPMVQIGTDGGLLPRPVSIPSLLLSCGERAEVVIDFSEYPVGTQIVLKNRLVTGGIADIMRFDIDRVEMDDAIVPAELRPIEAIPESEAATTRTFTLGMGMGMGMMGMGGNGLTINGRAYDPMRMDYEVKLGTTEIWKIVNPTMMTHPMHAHAIMYQILDRNGALPPANERGWKDTWLVPAFGTLRVIGRFTDFSCDPDPMNTLDSYMLHCHILEHEEHGMMAQYKVRGDGAAPSSGGGGKPGAGGMDGMGGAGSTGDSDGMPGM